MSLNVLRGASGSAPEPVSDNRNPDPIYDEAAAGVYIGGQDHPVSPRTMQRWRLEGSGPRWIRVGRLVRYRRSSLDAFLDAGECASTSEEVA